MAARRMEQMDIAEYVNERPRCEQNSSVKGNQTERRLSQLLLLSFGVLCITQAVLNVSLRLTLYSGKESTPSDCNTTHFTESTDVKVVQKDCVGTRNREFNRLQERCNALANDKSLLENRNTELNNMIKNLEEERDRLKVKLGEPIGPTSPQRCPANWREINSRCYFLSTELKTWEDSRKYCQSKDADLVVINNEQEQRDLYRLDGDPDVLFWIGLSKTTGSGVWKWVDGSALTQPFWQSGQPDHGGPNNVENCVEMYHFNPMPASWNDAPCGAKRHWLCEKGP